MSEEQSMTSDDITQKLALLPEGLAERNMQSWNEAVEYLGQPVDVVVAEHFPYIFEMHKIASIVSKNKQVQLFRADVEGHGNLVISTSDEQKLKWGQPFLRVYIDGWFLTARYVINEPYPDLAKEKLKISIKIMGNAGDEVMALSADYIMTALQPMLNLLWDETRGKKKV